jgi:hypothetical protein
MGVFQSNEGSDIREDRMRANDEEAILSTQSSLLFLKAFSYSILRIAFGISLLSQPTEINLSLCCSEPTKKNFSNDGENSKTSEHERSFPATSWEKTGRK